MNLLAHAHVALACASDVDGDTDTGADFVLGAVLPDLASMARVRVADRQRLAPDVDRGVTCHLRTDAAFHSLPAFVEGAATIRTLLRERGLARGAARAVGHVGWELLLDGTLVGSSAEAAFHAALDRADQAAAAFDLPDRWARLLTYRPQLRQLRYDDPAWIAERLERIFGDRPLLRFEPQQRPVVAEVLEAQVAVVDDVAESVLRATADALAPAA